MKIKKLLWQLALVLVFTGCKSSPKFEGRGDLCGLIVDELNNPVGGVVVTCRDNHNFRKSVLTNESGFFVFTDVPSDIYFISGYKENFVELAETEYAFFDRGKIFCCQIMDVNSALDKAENLILLEEYKECMDLINSIYCEKATNVQQVVTLYKEKLKEYLKEDSSNATMESDS